MYPYFRALQSRQDVEVMMEGKRRIMLGSNNYLGLTTDPEVIDLGSQVLRIVAFAEPLFGASIVASGALRGAGDSKGPFLINLATMWGVRITLSLALVGSLGLIGVWLAMAAELCARGLIFMVRLYRGKWLHIDLFAQKAKGAKNS